LLPAQIFTQMAFILQQEAIAFEDAALKLLSRAADGSMRDGLSLLDQAIVYGNGQVQAEEVRNMLGTVAQQPIEDLLNALAQGDAAAIFATINDIANTPADFGEVLQQLLQVLHRVALVQYIPGAIDHDFDAELLTALSSQMSPEDVQLFYQIGLMGQKDLDLAPDPRSGFEMVLLRMLTFKPATGQQTTAQQTTVRQNSAQTAPVPQAANKQALAATAPPLNGSSVAANNSDWLSMIVAMNLTGLTREFANNCVLESIDDSSCTLTIDPNYIRSAKAEDNLHKALQAYLGTALKLTVQAKKTTLATPAAQLAKEREDKQQAAVESIHSDPTLQALKEHFDARIMPGTIEPI
jgi:DNA polymerase-3 subunit gamma/tau